MSQSGWFKVHRQLFGHPLWKAEKYTKGQAWVELIGLANHAPGVFYVRGQPVYLERGQCGFAMLTLSERWRWSRGRVDRFFRRLENESMLTQKRDNKTTIITICNYERYQGEEFDDETPNGHQTDTKQDTNKNIKKKKKLIYIEAFEKWWISYPSRKGAKVGKKDSFEKFKKIKQKHWKELAIATRNYINVCGDKPKDPERFLKDDFWKDLIIVERPKSNNPAHSTEFEEDDE